MGDAARMRGTTHEGILSGGACMACSLHASRLIVHAAKSVATSLSTTKKSYKKGVVVRLPGFEPGLQTWQAYVLGHYTTAAYDSEKGFEAFCFLMKATVYKLFCDGCRPYLTSLRLTTTTKKARMNAPMSASLTARV